MTLWRSSANDGSDPTRLQPSKYNEVIAAVEQTQSDVAGKANVVHIHQANMPSGQFLKDDGTWATPPAGGTPPTGTGWRHITAGQEDAASSTPTKSDVGLGDADNTADASKPISSATQSALDAKAASSHAHAPSDVTGTAVVTADSRLSDTREPTTHGSDKHSASYEPASAAIQTHITSTGSPHTAAGVGAVGHALATAVNDFLVASGSGAFVKQTLAATLTILGKAVASGLASLDANSKLVQARARADDGMLHTALANDTLAQAYATNSVTKLTVTAARTLTTTVPQAGCRAATIILTSGTLSYVITFGAGFKPTGTLATGTSSGKVFVIQWISDGTNLYETSRTVAMTA